VLTVVHVYMITALAVAGRTTTVHDCSSAACVLLCLCAERLPGQGVTSSGVRWQHGVIMQYKQPQCTNLIDPHVDVNDVPLYSAELRVEVQLCKSTAFFC
jgi:hypothetical protein